MTTEGIFWYSEKQKKVGLVDDPVNYAKLSDGRTVEYTEWMAGKYINHKSNWDDAVCLGKGNYDHTKAR